MARKIIAVACYAVALAGGGAFAGFVLAHGLGAWPWPPMVAAPWVMVNLGWLLLFAVQHSGMARDAFKHRWLPASIERSVYAALSGLLLLALPLIWQPLPGPAWWQLPPFLILIPLLAGLALAAINARHDHAGLFGLRQAWAGDAPQPPEALVITGPYRHVRHPLMSCLLVFLWAQPTMTPTLGLLAGGLSGYILLGTVLEERDLLRRFGPAYAAYRRGVPRLVPWRSWSEGRE